MDDKFIKLFVTHSIERLEHFKAIKAGWDFNRGEVLNQKSLDRFNEFIALADKYPTKTISIFMTREGNIAIIHHEEVFNSDIEMEFFPDKIEYYHEFNEDEGTIRYEYLSSFMQLIGLKI